MKSKLAKLIDVKSIMTLMLTLVFCVLALCGTISGEQFLTIFVTIVGFYFGTQSMKKNEPAVPGYSGPQQGETVPGSEQYFPNEPVNEAVQNDVHPPDGNTSMAMIGFERDNE